MPPLPLLLPLLADADWTLFNSPKVIYIVGVAVVALLGLLKAAVLVVEFVRLFKANPPPSEVYATKAEVEAVRQALTQDIQDVKDAAIKDIEEVKNAAVEALRELRAMHHHVGELQGKVSSMGVGSATKR